MGSHTFIFLADPFPFSFTLMNVGYKVEFGLELGYGNICREFLSSKSFHKICMYAI